jgi:hypothetical protein
MNINFKVLTACILLIANVNSFAADNTFCGKSLPEIPTNCSDLNKSVTTNNPFNYTNPNASCNLDLSMPGMPSFGANLSGGSSSCDLVQGYASSTVGSLLSKANDILSSADVSISEEGVSVGGTTVLGGTTGSVVGGLTQTINNAAETATSSSDDSSASSDSISIGTAASSIFSP